MDIINILFHTWYGGLFLMIISSIIIAKSCDVFEVATDFLGRNLNEGVKGATLNAIGSSMPELLTTVFFLVFASNENLARDLGASVGGNTGSAIFNSIVIPMLVIGVVIAGGVKNINISKKVILRDGLFLIAAELLLLVLLSSDYITHWHGWVFTLFYVIYLSYTLLSMKKSDETCNDNKYIPGDSFYEKYLHSKHIHKTSRAWLLLFVSTMIIAASCAGLVEGCKGISDSFGINPIFIALILVAAASSVPDTIISIRDARKGNYDDALSNVLGSNVFDISISMGLPLAIFLLITNQKIDFTSIGPTLIDIRLILLIITIFTVGVFYFSKTLNKTSVYILAFLYINFIIYSLGAADYTSGGDSILAKYSSSLIDYLNKEGGINEAIRTFANYLTHSW